MTDKKKIPSVVWYGERGIVNSFVFSMTFNTIEKVLALLRAIKWNSPSANKWTDGDIHDVKILVEPSLGRKYGFGDPDLMIFFSGKNERYCIFLEAKASKYKDSAMSNELKDNKGYNSSINGQLFLRYLFAKADKNGRGEIRHGKYYLKKPRLLKVLKDLKAGDVRQANYYYVALTDDEKNPFENIDEDLLPMFDKEDLSRLGWINYDDIAMCLGLGDDIHFQYAKKTMKVVLPEEEE